MKYSWISQIWYLGVYDIFEIIVNFVTQALDTLYISRMNLQK